MRLRMTSSGAKWSILALQMSLLLNSYVTGEAGELLQAEESRSPYVILSQREYLVTPNGEYQEVVRYPQSANINETTFNQQLRETYVKNVNDTENSAYEQYDDDQSTAGSIRSQTFENPYVKFSINNNDDGDQPQGLASDRTNSIQDILGNRQGEWSGPTGSSTGGSNVGSSYNYPNSAQYGAPTGTGYDGNSNYYPGPSDQFNWPSSYSTPSPTGGNGGFPLSPFLGGIGQVTSSVANLKGGIIEQKGQTALQFGSALKNTADVATNAILNKGQTAAGIVSQTIGTAGNVLRSKGETVTRVIQGGGELASNALRSVGNVGSSVLRAKGELLGSVLRTGGELGGAALGFAANGLNKGTNIVRTKGEFIGNAVATGGRIATGVIDTKGRIISSVINAKGQFAANLIEAKGRAAATLLEAGGQKLNELADAIRSSTASKGGNGNFGKGGNGNFGGFKGGIVGPPLTYGWSETSSKYASPPPTTDAIEIKPEPAVIRQAPVVTTPIAVVEDEDVVIQPALRQHPMDYADTYYDPRDIYRLRSSRSNSQAVSNPSSSIKNNNNDQSEQEADTEEDFQNDYSSYYTPHQSTQFSPSYYRKYEWD